jgi:class 3 adenylate cyclase/tetratricopeptide (TPR) repeat protein
MNCPNCRSENREGVKFCEECGAEMALVCPGCGARIPPVKKFCGECGRELAAPSQSPPEQLRQAAPQDLIEKVPPQITAVPGERKQVTVLFSDLSGYTAMTERLDPEEVKEIMGRVFGEIAQVVTKYEGFIEKFIGDAVVAIFGVPRAHEDDPIRAIRAAQEIHDLVKAMSPKLEGRVGRPLAMHSGINTGLVVTGEMDPNKGAHGLLGDAINVASRLSGLAQAGEILVGRETHRQAEGHFQFETLEPAAVKGKAEAIQLYKLLSAKERPITVHRPSGLRAELIGRKAELVELEEAVRRLREGKGTIISICGDAGTGKSRLAEEFRATLDQEEILWLEGHAYAYSQNIPYFPLIDLLSRAWAVEEGDPPERVREKVESNLDRLMGKSQDIVPYIGGLYALRYPEVEGVSPEFWRSRLFDAVSAVLGALARRRPTVICLQDLHWADPSSLDLFRFVLLESRHPALFLFVYRPPFALLSSHQIGSLGGTYQEILLQDLSPSDTQDMMESLLRTKEVPFELRKHVQEKVEGNPFYVEEIVSSLIESGALTHGDGTWKLTRPIGESDIPPTVQGVISARLDRLEKEMKRILQEASVIGRAFLYEILNRITRLREQMDRCLLGLERLDFIRSRSIQPELEYIFKHALTQEVVYSGLLKKDRQELHQQIGLIMEEIFQARLPEFYETLAFHFKRGGSLHKAVEYLMKSGEKSLKRYAVEESHRYYQEAFDLLTNKQDISVQEKALLIELLLAWAYVFYYRGDCKNHVRLFADYQGMAESQEDRARLGMFYMWFGVGLYGSGRARESYEYLCKALRTGEEAGDMRVIGYACTFLTWTCVDLGLMEEAGAFGQRAQEIAEHFKSDPYLYFKSLGGLGFLYWNTGETTKALETGKTLLEYGQRYSNIRSQVMGHWIMGLGHMAAGDFPSAVESYQRAIDVSADPFYCQFPRTTLGVSYLSTGRLEEAENLLGEVLTYSQEFGAGLIGAMASFCLGAVLIARGDMTEGLRLLEEGQQACAENQRRGLYALSEYILGTVYLQIVQGSGQLSFSTIVKNIGFLVRNVPFAGQKAEKHLNRSLEVAREIGAKGTMSMSLLSLAQLHAAKGRKDKARGCASTAMEIFEQCDAQHYLKEARDLLASLG